MKKETKEELKTFAPLIISSTLVAISRWCTSPYWEGVLQGLAFGLLLIAAYRIFHLLRTAFKARQTYSQKKPQHGNHQTL